MGFTYITACFLICGLLFILHTFTNSRNLWLELQNTSMPEYRSFYRALDFFTCIAMGLDICYILAGIIVTVLII